MASQSDDEEGYVPSKSMVSRLLTVLPVETRLQIYKEVFRGSRVILLSVNPPYPWRKSFALRPSHHHQLLLVCTQIYAEALSTYWSSTIVDSALNPLFETVDFSEVLRTIPTFARPVIREIRCKGFRESVPGLNLKQFVDRFARIETVVMEPAFLYVSRRSYNNSDWSANMIINKVQRDLRRRFPMFGFDGTSNIQVLQRVQFPVVVRSRGMQIRLGARDKSYPAKIFFINHFKGLVAEGSIDTPDEVGFQEVL
ncbi:hypothetical protein INS49_015094 [Diaporthe citri]|uniref:uncharacterized protein n=1 Tax=Diaporthe citri TaxID=83186 RepID=UPI001C7EF051|nr:uncharacterized protein INS49_015094 [Diaporthe citri]KAG6357216.1 hypothetical protein INS49_015094 [Diaporthe citri]